MKILKLVLFLFLISCDFEDEYCETFPDYLEVGMVSEEVGCNYIKLSCNEGYSVVYNYDLGIMLGITEDLDNSLKISKLEKEHVIDNLYSNTTYYYLLYITNGVDTLTSYVKEFKTLPTPLKVGNIAMISLEKNILGSFVSGNIESIETVGFCCSSSTLPTIYDYNEIVPIKKDASFSMNVSDWRKKFSDVFYIRAFVSTREGILYSEVYCMNK